MDLKALLVEAKQKVPPVLQVLQMGDETMLDIGGTNADALLAETSLYSQLSTCQKLLQHLPGCAKRLCSAQKYKIFYSFFFAFFILGERGCTFCGGLGHRITDCPKLEAMQTKQVTNIGRKDYLANSSMDF